MYIKKIDIRGFRSFRRGILDDLSPGQNIIVGPNGSGKSSIVTALEFLLTRNFRHLNQLQRNHLMCNIQLDGQQTKSAEVTVWLDNSDDVFPIRDGDETTVVIKRVITGKTDQYFVNDKPKKFDEFAAMLESAGFSPNNSHFLVKQGFITEIAFGSPQHLLSILRAISGSEGYEDKKKKAEKLFSECAERITTLEGRIKSIEDQLKLLNIDRDKVREFQNLLKNRRFLTGRIARKEYDNIRAQVEQLNAKQAQLIVKMNEDKDFLNERKNSLTEKMTALKELEGKVKEAKETLQPLYCKQVKQNDEIIISLEGEIDELKQLTQEATEFESVKEEWKVKKLELDKLIEEIKKSDETQDALQEEIAQLDESIKNLIDVRRMLGEDATQSAEIRNRVETLKSERKNQKTLRDNCENQLDELKRQEPNLTDEGKRQLALEMSGKNSKIFQMKVNKKDLEYERRQNLIEISTLQKKIIDLESKLKKVSSNLNVFSGENGVRSRESMINLIKFCMQELELNDELTDLQKEEYQMIVKGYLGQFVDCIEIDPKLPEETIAAVFKPIEALLKNRIFHHVVVSDDVVHAILRLFDTLKREKGWNVQGNFQFIAINQIRHRPPVREDQFENEHVEGLMSFFNCSPEAASAFGHICHGKYICDSLEACDHLTGLNLSCDFATFTGEKMDSRGVISFVSDDMTKYQLFLEYKKLSDQLKRQKKDLSAHEKRYSEINVIIGNLDEEISKLEDDISRLNEQLKNANNHERMVQYEKKVDEQKAKKKLFDNKLHCLLTEINFWENELENPTDPEEIEQSIREKTALLNEQKLALCKLKKEKSIQCFKKQELNMKITIMEKGINNLFSKKIKLKTNQKNEYILDQQLTKYKALQAKAKKASEENEKTLKADEKLMSQLRSDKDNLELEMKEREETLKKMREKCNANSSELDDLHGRALNFQMDAEKFGAFRERVAGEFARFAGMNFDELNRELRNVNASINKITKGRLTEDAVRRFDDMHNSVAEMHTQIQDCASSIDSVREFKQTLEQVKQEVVERTYKQVNYNLQKIFRELVPNGSIQLQFIEERRSGRQQEAPRRNGGRSNRNGNRSVNRRQDFSGDSDDSMLQPSPEQPAPPSEQSSLSTNNTGSTIDSQLSSVDLARKFCMPVGERYSGLEIKVSFNRDSEMTSVRLLSGGQKALVSLAFTLALQKVDSTPFYIFDEVDANLDEGRRNDVAKLIASIAEREKKQFIITTFSSETAELGDAFFGVLNYNRLSRVNLISKEAALDFIRTGHQQISSAPETEESGTEAMDVDQPNLLGVSQAHSSVAPQGNETAMENVTEQEGDHTGANAPEEEEPMDQSSFEPLAVSGAGISGSQANIEDENISPEI